MLLPVALPTEWFGSYHQTKSLSHSHNKTDSASESENELVFEYNDVVTSDSASGETLLEMLRAADHSTE